jgi:hypothetical protein
VTSKVDFSFRSVAILQYNGAIKKLEVTKIGMLGIRQTIHITPKLGTVTFVESGALNILKFKIKQLINCHFFTSCDRAASHSFI